jgi:hypothetical protein
MDIDPSYFTLRTYQQDVDLTTLVTTFTEIKGAFNRCIDNRGGFTNLIDDSIFESTFDEAYCIDSSKVRLENSVTSPKSSFPYLIL